MEFTIPDLLSRQDDLLNDVGRIRWPEPERRRWLLDSQIAILAADATAGEIGSEDRTLNAGTVMQRGVGVGQGVRAIIDIPFNVVGGIPRDSIRYISRTQMDAQRPNWMREAASSTIKYWMPETGQPDFFLVYPKPKTGVVVRMRLSLFPTSSASNTPQLRPDFKAAMLHLATAWCFMKDDTPGDRENVDTHLQMAANGLRAAGFADEKLIQGIVSRTPPR